MPPSQVAKGEHAFYREYGRTLANWASIERGLCEWFILTTRMPRQMATAIFYSARSFNGRADMTEAAIGSSKLPTAAAEFIRSATTKAIAYSSFRNSISHGETVHLTIAGPERPLAEMWTIIQGGKGSDHRITLEQIVIAGSNFDKLATLLWLSAGYDPSDPRSDVQTSPEKCLERVLALPNQPTSATPSRKQLGRLRQRRASQASRPKS
jgi:hypothetical protein